jgi:glycosyltransferase involved in cell wall biosynthesis
MRLLFLPKYDSSGASSRQRIGQYIPYFEQAGHVCCLEPLFTSHYLRAYNAGQPVSKLAVIQDYIRRIISLLRADEYDLLIIQNELLPYMPAWFERWLHYRRIPFVLEYDDAIFHNYDTHRLAAVRGLLGQKIQSLALLADHVITGSPYLTAYFRQAGANVTEIPTSINLDEYPARPANAGDVETSFDVGWIGSRSTSRHLLTIADSLRQFVSDCPAATAHLIGFDKVLYPRIAHPRIKVVDWVVHQDFALLRPITVGVMPLPDEPFTRGKCGFKLIQYMAAGKPFIASPMEANLKIDHNHENLFANSSEEWYNALWQVANNRQRYAQVGDHNQQIATEYYSTQTNANLYLSVFEQVTSNGMGVGWHKQGPYRA